MYKTVDEASAALERQLAQYDDETADTVAPDLVAAVCWEIEDPEVVREFCRTELGFMTPDVKARLNALK